MLAEDGYKTTNWPEYNESLRKRGEITLWFTEDAIKNWVPEKTGKRGRPIEFSDHVIETYLLLRSVFNQRLRQTQGFMRSILKLMNLNLEVPDYSCVSKRSKQIGIEILRKAYELGSVVVVDSTGLKVYGKDEWHQEKHKVDPKRTFRRAHIAVDENHLVIACELTTPKTGDVTAVPDLLGQIQHPFNEFIADGAYDTLGTYQVIEEKQPGAKVIIPPGIDAVSSASGDTQRDAHIRDMEELGRMGWQEKTDYGRRSKAELCILRIKRIFGNTMKARELSQQKTELGIIASALNRMTQCGMPVSVKVAKAA